MSKQNIEIVQGDITSQDVDAIANAANERMLGGGGVDGAIHRAAGPSLLQACRAVVEVSPGVRCPTGQARITSGFLLKAKYVIHTVGPIYRDGKNGEPELLRACYINSLILADQHKLTSIAFPAISCGVYGYPLDEAATIAINAVREVLSRPTTVERVIFVCFESQAYQAFLEARDSAGEH